MGVSLCSLHVPSGFVRAGSDMHVSYVFTQGALTAITMVGGGAEIEALEQEPDMVYSCLVAKMLLLEWGLGPTLLEQKP